MLYCYCPKVDEATRHCFESDFALRNGAFFRFQTMKRRYKHMVKQIAKGKEFVKNTYWSAVGMATATMRSLSLIRSFLKAGR